MREEIIKINNLKPTKLLKKYWKNNLKNKLSVTADNMVKYRKH